MKIVVISDSHGNIANLKHVVGFAKNIKAKAIIHCGDWDNTKAIETVLSSGIPLYSVLGNADIDPDIGNIYKRVYLELVLEGKKIGVTHDIKKLESKDLDIVFFGHWQNQKEIKWNGIRAVNPGALENNVNFAVYDTKADEVEFIHE